MAISVARRVAFDVLRGVETQQAYASDLLRVKLGSAAADADFGDSGPPEKIAPSGVDARDAGLATEITLGVLRQRGILDFLIEKLAKRKTEALDLEVLIALRLGLYQMRFLDRVPASAAVNESVELAKRAGKTSAAGLVNAVLRRAAEPGFARASFESMVPASLPLVERLAILHSHPAWLVEKWMSRLGETETMGLLKANNHGPFLTGVFHHPASREADQRSLEAEGVKITPGKWLRDAFQVQGGVAARTQAFQQGRISIRDEASQGVTHLLGVRRGDSVLDVCAAPGGKSAALAMDAGEEGEVVAGDISAARLRGMKEQFKRLHLERVKVMQFDATVPLPFARRFSRILVDVPCSGTGTMARNPEIRWRLKAADFERLQKMQVAMLRMAIGALQEGGRLVYSTCSLEAEENEQVVDAVMKEHAELRRVGHEEMEKALAPHMAEGAKAEDLIDSEGVYRTFPPRHGVDGFFAVGVEKGRK
jgi:16S rRNA (cytosine967-C5)-methyltransferase